MELNLDRVNELKTHSLEEYEGYEEVFGTPSENDLFDLPTLIIVGYFLKVHSLNPTASVRQYLREHSISISKANEVKMILNILKMSSTN